MLPVINPISSIPLQTPLVATTMSDAIASLRVPPDNVAPSVSPASIDPNASRGNSFTPMPEAAAAPTVATTPSILGGTFLINSGAGFWASPQATFLAQVIGQDLTAESRVVLVQYERIMRLGDVKYKPSNATLPMPDPAGIFGRLLQEEKSLRVSPPQAPPPAAEEAAVSADTATALPVRPVLRPTRAVRIASRVAGAYQATAQRNDVITVKAALKSIEENEKSA
jgi:hypothetical protein